MCDVNIQSITKHGNLRNHRGNAHFLQGGYRHNPLQFLIDITCLTRALLSGHLEQVSCICECQYIYIYIYGLAAPLVFHYHVSLTIKIASLLLHHKDNLLMAAASIHVTTGHVRSRVWMRSLGEVPRRAVALLFAPRTRFPRNVASRFAAANTPREHLVQEALWQEAIGA
jgi:hypothetical protein